MEMLNPQLLNVDVVVLVSSIYYYDINAQWKAVIDRFYANNAELQGNKKTVLMVTANNSWTLEDLKKTDFLQKAYELGKNLS